MPPTLDRILALRRAGQSRAESLGETADPLADLFTFYGINPSSPEANIIRSRIADGEPPNDVFLEFAALAQTGPFAPTGGGAGAGRAPPAFSGTQVGIQFQNDLAVAEAKRQEALAAGNTVEARRWEERIARIQRAFTTSEREAGEEFAAEQNALAEEAALKRQRLSTLTDLIQSFMSAQSQARDTLANLQPDPFRFAAVAGGIAPFGTTPQQGFQQQLQQFAGAAVPSFDPSGSAASLEPVIAQLTGAQAPQAPTGFQGGLAGGGTVPAPFDVMSARLVGEGGPEVMITGPQGVTILPLGKGAQEGGFFPFEPIKFDKSTLLPALGTSGIFGSLGFESIPTSRAGPSGIGSAGNVDVAGGEIGFGTQLTRLGIGPRLVKDVNTGRVYWRDPSGTLHWLSPNAFRQLGAKASDIVDLNITEISRLGPFGAELHEAPPAFSSTEQTSPFTKFSQPIIEPTTGTLLPAPFMVASQMNRLRVTNPGAFNLLLSAYDAAGVPGLSVLSTIQQALPFGQARTNIGLR